MDVHQTSCCSTYDVLIGGAGMSTIERADSDGHDSFQHGLTPVTNKIYVPDLDGNNVTVIDGATLTIN